MKKKLLTATLLIATLGVLYALSQGANNPGTVADNSAVGTTAWTNPMNATSSDAIYATAAVGAGSPVNDTRVSIIKSDGSIGATNYAKAPNWNQAPEAFFSYGGSSDLWGETWTPTDINNSNFGVVLEVTSDTVSHYLKATNYGFSIPANATINGILVEIQRYSAGPIGGGTASVDVMRITVYYTSAGVPNFQIKTGTLSVKSGKIIIH